MFLPSQDAMAPYNPIYRFLVSFHFCGPLWRRQSSWPMPVARGRCIPHATVALCEQAMVSTSHSSYRPEQTWVRCGPHRVFAWYILGAPLENPASARIAAPWWNTCGCPSHPRFIRLFPRSRNEPVPNPHLPISRSPLAVE